jgi:hypothetical protein
MVKPRVVQQVSRSLDGVEGKLRHGTPLGRLMWRLFWRRQLADVTRAETLLQPQCRGEHSTASYQVILLLKPKDLWNVGWPEIIQILHLILSTKQRRMLVRFGDDRTIWKLSVLLMFRRFSFTYLQTERTM